MLEPGASKGARRVLRGRRRSNAPPLPDWKPPFYLLEAAGFECWLVNARDVKNVPGRPKTDKLDAVWLAQVAERGMCRPSLVHPAPIRRLRDLTRYRRALIRDRGREMQRVEKLLEDAQIKLSSVVSDLFGVSGRAMMRALIAGQRDPVVLAAMAKGRPRAKTTALQEALTGFFTDHHATILHMMLANIDRLSGQIAALDAQVAAASAPFAHQVDQLDAITAVGLTSAQELIAEIGVDMSRFPTAAHLVSWAKFCPQVHASAGKTKNKSRGGGNPWLAGTLDAPTPSSAPATGVWPAAAASRRRSLPPATPCSPSSTTCWPTPTPSSVTLEPTTTTRASTRNAAPATSPPNSRPPPARPSASATARPSSSTPNPKPPDHTRPCSPRPAVGSRRPLPRH